MSSKLVQRDLEADVVSPEWQSAFREVKFMLVCNPTFQAFSTIPIFPISCGNPPRVLDTPPQGSNAPLSLNF